MIKNRENVSIFIIYFLEKLLLIFKTATGRDWSEDFELVHVNVCVLVKIIITREMEVTLRLLIHDLEERW